VRIVRPDRYGVRQTGPLGLLLVEPDALVTLKKRPLFEGVSVSTTAAANQPKSLRRVIVTRPTRPEANSPSPGGSGTGASGCAKTPMLLPS
jgi:hypothetical protein